MDLYRLEHEEEAERAGIADMLLEDALTLVEWPERVPGLMPDDAHLLQIEAAQRHKAVHLSALRVESDGLGYLGAVMDTGRKAIKALAREAALLPQEELLEAKKGQAGVDHQHPGGNELAGKACSPCARSGGAWLRTATKCWWKPKPGANAQFSDNDYSEAGARIVYDKSQVFQAGIVLKVEPPSLEEVALMGMRQTLISALQLSVQNEGLLEALSSKKTTAIAWDFVQNENGIQPLVRAMGEIAGNTAILIAGELMASEQGMGNMLGGVSGVRPSEVVILGAGTVGEFAARSALGLGATVKVFDNSVHRLIRLQNAVGQRLWTSTLQPSVLEEALATADVAIGAVQARDPCPDARQRTYGGGMRERSIVVDVGIDQGGVFETSRLTSHERPTFIECGVIHCACPTSPPASLGRPARR